MKKFLLVLGLLIAGAFVAPAQVREISDDDWDNYKIVRPVVIDFYADWCGPCRKLAPHLERLSVEYKGRVDFLRINVDKNKVWASEYGVESIPFLLWVCDVNEDDEIDTEETVGYFDYDQLKELVEGLISDWNAAH